MAKKQRVLESLRAVESELRKAAKTGSKKNAVNIMQNLTAIRDVCRISLPEDSYAKYGEIYDGLILAVEQMTKVKELRLNEEAFSLSMDLLQYLIRITEEETGFKKDIVFLPYKASMWDSLESVWKAASEDEEHCNAYVIPIPYADLNPDGSIARWHCERADYPIYVPTLDWRSVDLKELHPDVIFIHNPYDDENRVTSIETRYYSKNLRECTDELVYIPYFVLDEPCTEESIEHFVLTPVVFNADKIIVQSETMRELYINILTKKTNQTNRAYWEKRISGAGSPKIDKALTSKKEDFVMPRKWKQLVKGKKIILYNTSLTTMLRNSDKVCDKLRYVFDVFRNRDDVALWWRPHPLMKATFHSMRPEIEKEYLKIEKQYIEEGWGIYDDTPDLHRAICWSDAYYGDASSVVALYLKTRKPLMLQDFFAPNIEVNMEITERICQGVTSFLDAVHNSENTFVFFDHIHSAVIEYDINSCMGYIKRFLHCPGGIAGIYNMQGKWFLVSQYLNKIFVLDIDFKLIEEYQWKDGFHNHAVIMEKGCIYGLAIEAENESYCFDCNTRKFRKYTKLKKVISATGICDTDIGGYVNQYLNFITITIVKHNMVILWDLALEEKKIINLGSAYKVFSAIFDGNGFWIAQPDSLEILYWDSGLKSYTKKIKIDGTLLQSIEPYSSMVVHGEYLIVLPRGHNRVVAINRLTDQVYTFPLFEDETRENNAGIGSAIVGYSVANNLIYLYPNAVSKFYILDLERMRMLKKEIFFNEKDLVESFVMHTKEEIPIFEKGSNIVVFLEWLMGISNMSTLQNEESKLTRRIWSDLYGN